MLIAFYKNNGKLRKIETIDYKTKKALKSDLVHSGFKSIRIYTQEQLENLNYKDFD